MMQKYSDNRIQTKEEMQKSDEQRFLDNLLKIETPQKSKQAPQIAKIEEGKDHKEKTIKYTKKFIKLAFKIKALNLLIQKILSCILVTSLETHFKTTSHPLPKFLWN